MIYPKCMTISLALSATLAVGAVTYAAEKTDPANQEDAPIKAPAYTVEATDPLKKKVQEKADAVRKQKILEAEAKKAAEQAAATPAASPQKKTEERVSEAKARAADPKADEREEILKIVEKAIEAGNQKLAEEADRVPGLKYDDISRLSAKIPGKVLVPDPMSRHATSRAISVPGGLVSDECKHFARGFIAKRLLMEHEGMTSDEAVDKVINHLHDQRLSYAKLAGFQGLERSHVAAHDADCPVCGPLNAAEIACHKAAVKKSPIRELVMFDYASDVLRGGYLDTIENIKTLLQEDNGLLVALIGRASIPGGPVPNFTLSAKRITSVWHGLAKAGIPVDRIVAIPIGEDEPHIDLQLAVEYGLTKEFQAVGQQPLNQSVYMVVFRP